MLFRLIAININTQNNIRNLFRKQLLVINKNNNKIQQNWCEIQTKYFSTFLRNRNKLFNQNKSLNANSVVEINGNVIQVIVKQFRRHLGSDYDRFRRLSANKTRNQNVVLYSTAFVLTVLAGTYASVPLYRIYCQSTGKGGKPFIDEKQNQKIIDMKPIEDRLITVTFSAETTSQSSWNFKPTQSEIRCTPGETVLAFFTAKNPLEWPVDGIATYTVQPFEAGSYLHKIQCFCFEEQRLNPHEEVDLPVFFYIDPDYASDPNLEDIDNIVLSYTFFEAKKGGMKLTTFNKAAIPPVPTLPPIQSPAVQKL